MSGKIKILLVGSLLLLLSGCLTPLDTGAVDPDAKVLPLDLQKGNSWKFRIHHTSSPTAEYIDSFHVRAATSISYRGRTVDGIYPVEFPALQHYNTDTLLIKYWRLEEGELVEYGWEKRSRKSDMIEYGSRIYTDSLVIADFNRIKEGYLFDNDAVKIYQEEAGLHTDAGAVRRALPVRYIVSAEWCGMPRSNYRVYFSNSAIFDLEGEIAGVSFWAEPLLF